jgi:hypothetical protein
MNGLEEPLKKSSIIFRSSNIFRVSIKLRKQFRLLRIECDENKTSICPGLYRKIDRIQIKLSLLQSCPIE